jgi:GNAT superfamily N-acetyltransferase
VFARAEFTLEENDVLERRFYSRKHARSLKPELQAPSAMLEARFKIKPVRTAADLEVMVRLFNEYASSVGVDLSYQDFATELASLPGKYASPMGELLLARDKYGEPAGCVGLRPIEPEGCCEMKRLYVSPKARGLGLGRALIDGIDRRD